MSARLWSRHRRMIELELQHRHPAAGTSSLRPTLFHSIKTRTFCPLFSLSNVQCMLLEIYFGGEQHYCYRHYIDFRF
jgi:hypothetical protein